MQVHKMVRKFTSGSMQKYEKNMHFYSFKFTKLRFQVGSPETAVEEILETAADRRGIKKCSRNN